MSNGPSGDTPGDPGHDDVVDVGPGEPEDILDEVAEVLDAADHLDPDPGDRELATARAERDEYLEALRRLQAEYENSRKRWDRERLDVGSHAARSLAEQLLPVLDACEAAIGQGASDVDPIAKSLFEILQRLGLEVLRPDGSAFDPNEHEAVMFEAGDGAEQVVAETLRTGYAWKGQVLRAAMVRVRG